MEQSASRTIRRQPSVSTDAVLDTAERLLRKHGFDGISVRRIAEELGASRQVVYTHFAGMNGLLDELHRRLSRRLIDAVDAVDAPGGTITHLVGAAAAYRATARRWPELYQLVFERPITDYEIGPAAVAEGVHSFEMIIDIAAQWLHITAGVADPSRRAAVDLARAMWSSLHGFVVLERVGFATPVDTDRLSEQSVVALLDGWSAS
ncbi:MAG: TetR/AcrR family transcriptional regulator [Actinomycetota bacterium]